MIDKAATVCGSKSEVARKLGVSPQTLYNWESDRRSMPDEKLDQLAHLAGYDPIKALGEYHHERMRKKRTTPARAGIAAALSFLAVASSGAGDARATPHGFDGVTTLHIMRNWRRLLASLMRRDDRRSPFATCSQAKL
jgi:transcriptional regulator with XRE-family HTH domain